VEDNEMALAFNRPINPKVERPEVPVVEDQSRLDIAVIFTSVEGTLGALKAAGSLAESLGARVTLLVPQVVPYPLPLTSPPIPLEFQEKRFQEIAAQSPVEIQVQLYLCRNGMDTLKTVLKPHSLVVIGGRKRWWPTREKNMARELHGLGHEVVFSETK